MMVLTSVMMSFLVCWISEFALNISSTLLVQVRLYDLGIIRMVRRNMYINIRILWLYCFIWITLVSGL